MWFCKTGARSWGQSYSCKPWGQFHEALNCPVPHCCKIATFEPSKYTEQWSEQAEHEKPSHALANMNTWSLSNMARGGQ